MFFFSPVFFIEGEKNQQTVSATMETAAIEEVCSVVIEQYYAIDD